MRASEAWKTVEAGAGVVLIGALEYVSESTDVATWLEHLMPRPIVPLVPIVLGGVLLTVRVFKRANVPPASEAMPTLDEPAPTAILSSDGLAQPSVPALAPASSAATPPAVTPATEDAGAIVGSPLAAAAATDATDGATPAAAAVPALRDPAAAAAVARSLEPAPAEPFSPPTSFIPLPTR